VSNSRGVVCRRAIVAPVIVGERVSPSRQRSSVCHGVCVAVVMDFRASIELWLDGGQPAIAHPIGVRLRARVRESPARDLYRAHTSKRRGSRSSRCNPGCVQLSPLVQTSGDWWLDNHREKNQVLGRRTCGFESHTQRNLESRGQHRAWVK
jgi:hypothetical protein